QRYCVWRLPKGARPTASGSPIDGDDFTSRLPQAVTQLGRIKDLDGAAQRHDLADGSVHVVEGGRRLHLASSRRSEGFSFIPVFVEGGNRSTRGQQRHRQARGANLEAGDGIGPVRGQVEVGRSGRLLVEDSG